MYYNEKISMADYDTSNKESPDFLLRSIYLTGVKGKIEYSEEWLAAFNTAYFIAACINSAEIINARDVFKLIRSNYKDNLSTMLHFNGYDTEAICRNCAVMSVEIMIYAILFLQAEKKQQLEKHIISYRKYLIRLRLNNTIARELINYIDKYDYRYETDLQPNADFPIFYSDTEVWDYVSLYTKEDYEEQLTFFRTREKQTRFIKWAREMGNKNGIIFEEKDVVVVKNVLTDKYYQELLSRIEMGEFLRYGPEANPRQASLQAAGSPPPDADALELSQAKIKALEAQLASAEKQMESHVAEAEAGKQTALFNDMLEKKYKQLQEKYEAERRANKEKIESMKTLSDQVLGENRRLKEQLDQMEQKLKNQKRLKIEMPTINELVIASRMNSAIAASADNSTACGIKKSIEFGICHACNTDDVTDAHVEPIKNMLEGLIYSKEAECLDASDKLELTKKLHEIKSERKAKTKQQAIKDGAEALAKAAMKPIHINQLNMNNGSYKENLQQ